MEIIKINEGITGQEASNSLYSNDLIADKQARTFRDLGPFQKSGLSDNNTLLIQPYDWTPVEDFEFGSETEEGQLHFVKGATSSNMGFQLLNCLTIGQVNTIRFRAKSSENNVSIFLADQFNSEAPTRRDIILSTDFKYYEVSFTPTNTTLYIAFIQGGQPQSDVYITEIYTVFATDLGVAYDESRLGFKTLIPQNDANMLIPNFWAANVGGTSWFTKNNGYITMQFAAGVNRVLQLSNVLTPYIGKITKLKISVNSNIDGAILQVGSVLSNNIGNPDAEKVLTLKEGPNEIYVDFIPNGPNLNIGVGATRAVTSELTLSFFAPVEEYLLEQRLSTTEATLSNLALGETAVLPVNDAELLLPNGWVAGLGGASWFTKNDGSITLNTLAGANLSIQLVEVLTIGRKYRIEVSVDSDTQDATLQIGSNFSSSPNPANENRLVLNEGENLFNFTITASSPTLQVGAAAVASKTAVLVLNYIRVYSISELEDRLEALEGKSDTNNRPPSFYTDDFLQSFSKYDKPLTTLTIDGDSLMANEIGGPVPDFEGEGRFPLMLSVNNIPRRVYDLISWNKPQWRNLFDADWIKSGWTDDKNSVLNRAHTLEHYYLSQNGATASITIPAGYSNFAIICRKISSAGRSLSVNMDGTPITVGNPVIQLSDTYTTAFHIEQYLGIDNSQSHAMQITASGACHVWGIFYWEGNTLAVSNVARGGHTLGGLMQYFDADVTKNNPDAVLFEVTELNNLRDSLDKTVSDLSWFVGQLKGKDHCFMSCNPLGRSPLNPDTNYYAMYDNPNQEQVNKAVHDYLYSVNEPFVDVFNAFKWKIQNRGGTLENGEGGLWYTQDGQHGSPDGQREWFNIIRYIFENKPIRY